MPTTDPDIEFEFDLWDELKATIAERVSQHERSLQVEVGPSGLGTPCDRKLAHRLANTPPVNDGDVPWRPTVGTAVHTWLEAMMQAKNAQLGRERYLTEFAIVVGTINGREITGHVDVYDRDTKTIIDWKIAGPKSLKDHHAHGMGDEYRVQQHTYGYAVNRMPSTPVDRIACCFLPMNGELRDGYVLSEVLDPSIRKAAFARARKIEAKHTEIIESVAPEGPFAADAAEAYEMLKPDLRKFFRKLSTAPDYCSRCPWFAPGAVDFEAACPGAPEMYEGGGSRNDFEGLM